MFFRTTKILKLLTRAVVLLFLLPFFAQAQEELLGLQHNEAIAKFKKAESQSQHNLKRQQNTGSSSLQMPFFDDFTYSGPYPDATLWADSAAFINTSFQKNPVNRGVATLDALDKDGKIYAHASQYSFIADHLTSRPIRTDTTFVNGEDRPITPADSLYLSFFYQPQGMGDAPNRNDSLVLEFFVQEADTTMRIDSIFHPADTIITPADTIIMPAYYEKDTILTPYPAIWKRIWATPGMPLDTFYAKYGRWMVQMMIPITDTIYFRPDFKFRFCNYASLASSSLPSWQSNMDQWQIDYVYLNYNRFWFDTTYHDISFIESGGSLLKDFTAMPYIQFQADVIASMKSSFMTSFANLDNVAQNAAYKYRIYDPNGNQIGSDEIYYNTEWTAPIAPVITSGIQTIPINVQVAFTALKGTSSIKQTLKGDVNVSNRLSDSITYYQNLTDYFAYDDGVPEAGYGLSTTNSSLAVRFPLNIRDTLQAVDIYFNTTPERQASDHIEYFKLMIWNDNHGTPDIDTIYSAQETLRGGEAGQFVKYYIRRPLFLSSGFFVGVQQTTSDNINIGFDYSNNMKSRNMYKILNNKWMESYYDGAIMIRPIMGKTIVNPSVPTEEKKSEITVFPNPALNSATVSIIKPETFDNSHTITLFIYNQTGQKVYEAPCKNEQLPINGFNNGLYIIRLLDCTTGQSATVKLIINR
jgi:hypothetical protein